MPEIFVATAAVFKFNADRSRVQMDLEDKGLNEITIEMDARILQSLLQGVGQTTEAEVPQSMHIPLGAKLSIAGFQTARTPEGVRLVIHFVSPTGTRNIGTVLSAQEASGLADDLLAKASSLTSKG